MALDIKEGDILTLGGVDYPIRSCAEWEWPYAAGSMKRLCSKTASTKRSPAIASGKRGAPATNLTGLSCMPLDPVDAELARRLAIETPHELKQTVVDGSNVFYQLVVEELKR